MTESHPVKAVPGWQGEGMTMTGPSLPRVGRARAVRRRWAPVLCALLLAATAGPDPATAAPGAASARAGVVIAASAPESAPGYPWKWPADGARHVVDPFRAPAHEYGAGHRGMDVSARPGSPVRAPAAGVIAFRGGVADRPLITIDHGAGHVTTLEPVASDLAPGAPVAAGTVMGAVADGGHARRGTLHVGVRVDGRYVDPRALFGTGARAVLLPCCGE